ncbi:hypothetical protein CL628_03730 [bacterium]|nr:hypothetical protein [bacterium]|tara:strand:- start:453 stop:977 length:525 start_codon:yes stop_codon:yes gene_type:complete
MIVLEFTQPSPGEPWRAHDLCVYLDSLADLRRHSAGVRQQLVAQARSYVGVASYEFRNEVSLPPLLVNCHTYLWWVYQSLGIYMPWHFLEQLQWGRLVPPRKAQPGDFVYRPGQQWNLQVADESGHTYRVGHVGLLTECGTVIHASQPAGTVIEVPTKRFFDTSPYHAFCRMPL